MNLNLLMNQGIKRIMKTAKRYYAKSQPGCAFLSYILPQIHRSANIRSGYEESGTHIPPFLIASISSQCNLHCAGCYARANGTCDSEERSPELSAAEWQSIFEEAARLGISFILIAGGEPFMRRDVIEAATHTKEIIFPVFTNGTMIDDSFLSLLDKSRNLIPILSLEGSAGETDARRGKGVYDEVSGVMKRLQDSGILFGVSITVTKANMRTVTEPSFISGLRDLGCGLAFFIEYVPVQRGTEYLVLNKDDLDVMRCAVSELKGMIGDMVILSFPGDEDAIGGCLASGRGFFHISASGGAEPCPFSPYAKHSLKTCSIIDVLESDYFAGLRDLAQNAGEHNGGCTLFAEEKKVLSIIAPKQKCD